MTDYTLTLTGPQIDAALGSVPSSQVYYNQSTNTVNASANVSSVTDSSAGDFTINFTTLYAAATYVVAYGIGQIAIANDQGGNLNANTRATGALDCCSGFAVATLSARADRTAAVLRVSGALV